MDLQKLYSPSQWSKRYSENVIIQKHIDFIHNSSQQVQDRIKCQLNIPYGKGERELIDIYGIDLADDAPIFIHLHGGYWQEESIRHSNNTFIAKNLHLNKIKSFFIGYELCPKVTLEQILKNIEKAIRFCLDYIKSNNTKTKGIHLSGHSAGAQLVATMFNEFIPSLPKENRKLFKSAFLLCGIYDLIPLTRTEYNKPMNLDEESAKVASPLFQKLNSCEGTIFYVVVAEFDSPVFVEEGQKMHKHLEELGIKSSYLFIKDVDHFDLIEKLFDKDFELTKCVINVIVNAVN